MKKLTAFIMVLGMLVCMGLSAYAQAPRQSVRQTGDGAGLVYYEVDGHVLYDDEGVPIFNEARMKDLRKCFASISRSSNVITVTGTIDIQDNYEVDITVQLQKSTNGTSWSNVDKAKVTGRATKTGITIVSDKFTVSKGYQYRAKVTRLTVLLDRFSSSAIVPMEGQHCRLLLA